MEFNCAKAESITNNLCDVMHYNTLQPQQLAIDYRL